MADAPKRFVNPRDRRLHTARGFLERVKQSLRRGTWRELKGIGCGEREADDGASDGVAIVVDANANIKALTILGGSDDHFHEVRSFYDDSGHLRFLFVKYADVHGGMTENILYFDAKGDLAVCDILDLGSGGGGWDLCADDSPQSMVDPEVATATQTQQRHVASNELRERFRMMDPRQTFQGCPIQDDFRTSNDASTGLPVLTEQKSPSPEARGACLKYEPESVVVRGVIERATFPGPPNYQSIANGDAREACWLIRLEQPLCVDAASGTSDQSRSDIRKLQLVFPAGGAAYVRYRHLLGRRIEARGTLFGAQTGHHHTEILLTVNDLWPGVAAAK